jgi:hypothetical protein
MRFYLSFPLRVNQFFLPHHSHFFSQCRLFSQFTIFLPVNFCLVVLKIFK